MIAVYKRELKAAFHSMIGWIFEAAMLFFIGLYFSIYNLGQGYPYVAITLSSILFVVILAIPILTMRIMTEDVRYHTDKLLYTAPVKTMHVILGKYFAMLTLFVLPLLIVCLMPVFLSLFGSVPYLETYIAILGFFVYGAACIAIGLFVSSLTENQIVAAVLSFVALFLGYMMSGITGFVSTDGNLLTKILNVYSFSERLKTFFDGVCDLPSFLYFITLAAVFLFFTYEVMQKKKFSVSTGRIKRGAFSTGLIVLVVAAAVGINYAATFLPDSWKQFDVTQEGLYEIGDVTKEHLAVLNDDVTIYVLSSKEGTDSIVDRLLSKYKDESSHIHVEYKDPALYPEFGAKYGADSAENGSLIVESAKRYKLIPNSSLFETEIDYTTYSQQITGFDGEGQLTGAIDYVTGDELPVLYQVSGHGELAISGALQTAIEKENVQIETLNLMEHEAVPEDAAGLVIMAPTQDYSEDDANKVAEYLENGGKAMVVTTWTNEGLPHLTGIFGKYGMTLTKGLVVDPAVNYYYQNPYCLLPDIASSVVSSDLFLQNRNVLVPYAQGIRVQESDEEGAPTILQILTTSDEAYAKQGGEMDNWEYEDGDEEGPFALGIYMSRMNDDISQTELLWLTTENMLSEQANAMTANANFELIGNMIARMKGEESGLSIPVKKYMAENFTIPRSVFFFGFAITTLLIPAILIGAGLIIWLGRRKK
ncbi:MAG: Gldg family protein [Lachnospiraceae bacterium]|nr:Gldg family protein [Lachnospiraceae bacterium]